MSATSSLVHPRHDEGRSIDRRTLRHALADADLMLSYAAQRGISLDKNIVEKLVAAITAEPRSNLTDQQELDFWLAHTALSKAILPVDSESLKASTKDGKPSAADTAAKRYRWHTIVTLVLLLMFQIYWLIGATVVSDIEAIENRMKQLAPAYEKAYYDSEAAASAMKEADAKKAGEAQFKKLANEVAERLRLQEVAWAPLNIEQIKAQADFDVLTAWNSPNPLQLWVKTFRPNVGPPSSGETNDTTAQQSNKDVQQLIKPKPNEVKPQFYLWVFTPETVKQMQTAKIALTTLVAYILPILYGALGASAFIVRALADRIRAITYTAESNVGYELRFYLGAVAGLSIAWFTSGDKGADTAGMLQSLSPLALAFLAGFSVELLFSLLERVVAAFSVSASKTAT
jgi:hypothetical protein